LIEQADAASESLITAGKGTPYKSSLGECGTTPAISRSSQR